MPDTTPTPDYIQAVSAICGVSLYVNGSDLSANDTKGSSRENPALQEGNSIKP